MSVFLPHYVCQRKKFKSIISGSRAEIGLWLKHDRLLHPSHGTESTWLHWLKLCEPHSSSTILHSSPWLSSHCVFKRSHCHSCEIRLASPSTLPPGLDAVHTRDRSTEEGGLRMLPQSAQILSLLVKPKMTPEPLTLGAGLVTSN